MSSKTRTTATKEQPTPPLVPKLRFPEFWGTLTRRHEDTKKAEDDESRILRAFVSSCEHTSRTQRV